MRRLPSFCGLHASRGVRSNLRRRQRDLFPIGLLDDDELNRYLSSADPGTNCHRFAHIGDLPTRSALDYINGVILGLNWLYGIRAGCAVASRHSVAQRAALCHLVACALQLHSRLAEQPPGVTRGWSLFQRGAAAERIDLIADAVDVPVGAGCCRPSSVVGRSFARLIDNKASIFRYRRLGWINLAISMLASVASTFG